MTVAQWSLHPRLMRRVVSGVGFAVFSFLPAVRDGLERNFYLNQPITYLTNST